jgi:DNA polymerase III epsilon subunit-like protein
MSADNISGYVFPICVNYDPNADLELIEENAKIIGDHNVPYPFRKYARLWLQADYEDSVKRWRKRKQYESSPRDKRPVTLKENKLYRHFDIDSIQLLGEIHKLPSKGMQVHFQYMMFAYMRLMCELVRDTEKVRFYLDLDSGLRGAFLTGLEPLISEGRCEGFCLQVNKEYTNDQKRRMIAVSKRLITAYKKKYPKISEHQIKLLILKQRIKESLVKVDRLRWLHFPFNTMYEPEKAVAHITAKSEDLKDWDLDHLARIYNRVSMHALDGFFEAVRNKISSLRRPDPSSSDTGKRYYQYSNYNPALIVKFLTIYRFYYNYVNLQDKWKWNPKVGKHVLPEQTTPAMRLGLAEGPIDLKDLFSGRSFSDDPKTVHKNKLLKFNAFERRSGFTPTPLPDTKIEPDVLKPHAELLKITEWDGETVFIDFETTGLGKTAKVVEVAVIDNAGNILLNTLVNPDIPIPKDVAAKSHHITDDMVKNKPTFKEIEPQLLEALIGKRLVAYNLDFDLMFIPKQVIAKVGPKVCCMDRFSVYYSNFSKRSARLKGKAKSKSLAAAADFIEYRFEGNPHRALADTLACRAVWQFLESQDPRQFGSADELEVEAI